MIRITKMSGTYCGLEMSGDDEFEMSEINSLASQGWPSIVVNEISDLKDFGIHADVTMIERD